MFTTYGRPPMSMPLAATSVAIRILTLPSLNFSSAFRRSCIDLIPANTAHVYAPYLSPPPAPARNFSRLSQSRFVLQKTRTCSISSCSMSLMRAMGLAALIFSLFFSLSSISSHSTASSTFPYFLCTASVLTNSLMDEPLSPPLVSVKPPTSSSGSTRTTQWWTVSGTDSFPFRSTHMGLLQISLTRPFTGALWRVAEKKQTCKSFVLLGIALYIPLTLSMLSFSHSWSASSSTKNLQRAGLIFFWRRKSWMMTHDPTRTSTSPPFSFSIVSLGDTPPTSSADLMGGVFRSIARFTKALYVCSARSRVGSRTMASGPFPALPWGFPPPAASTVALFATALEPEQEQNLE
mmetsp:Transcript_18732/g.37581  ORF Transcript_18732/g.37581 Transcript_18732/m.37581 type:complete len:349 (-) Transcript_18732:277-1323(-)